MVGVDVGIGGISEATEIGRGGFGVVYRAREADLGRTVAVKVLHGGLDEPRRGRFDRERHAMGSLSGHPHIVTVFRTGFCQSGRPFLVMEYLEGGSLADHLERFGPLPWREVGRLGVEIADALVRAHEAGVLHRDLKPANILRTATGVAKLGDFGIARVDGAPETTSSVITASLAHAPPEVLAGVRPDERADIYSLASTLYELATGASAFAASGEDSILPMLSRIAQQSPAPLASTGMPAATWFLSFYTIGTLGVPNFLLGVLLLWAFAVNFHWFPASGRVSILDNPVDSIKHLFLPALALGSGLAAVLARYTRTTVQEAMGQDYIRTARAKGLFGGTW